jgi:Tfp pilus assembly protein PilO
MSRRAPLIAAIVFGLLSVAAAAFLVMPKMNDVGKAEERLQEAEEQELVLQTELQRLQAAAENADELRRELAQFRRAVPPVADLPGLINQLQDAATASGVDFFSISPGTPTAVPAGGAAEVPAQIQVIGGFFPVDEFLFRLETLPRSSKAVNITVAEGPEGLPQVDVSLDVRFYTTDLDAGPGAAPEAAPGASPAPEESPSPGATPSPGESPAEASPEAALPSPIPGG